MIPSPVSTDSPSTVLLELGRHVLAPYAALPGVACAAITGSCAEELSDHHSDLDTTVYYDVMPPEEQIRAVRSTLTDQPLLWALGSHADGEFIESFRVRGVECQIGHTTVARWERDIEQTLTGQEPGGPGSALHKAMSGTLISVPVFGADRLEGWKARIRAYPDALRTAMVRHHLKFFAIWAVNERLEVRDSNLWFRQTLVDSSFNLIGICAGLSRRYFTTFQFKRARRFIDSLSVAPAHLWQRLEDLWQPDVSRQRAADELRTLVAETVALVERELPWDATTGTGVDTTVARRTLARTDPRWG